VIKSILLIVVIIVVALASFEIVALWRLKGNIARYAAYWKQYPASGTFTYVALGDSAAQGLGASKPQLGYVGLLANQIAAATGKTVRIVNLSVSGAKIEDVLTKQLPELKNYKPDLLTVEIGSNDVVRFNAQTFQTQYDTLAAALPAGTVVSNIPYFGGRIRKNPDAITASQIIGVAATKNKLKLVDLQTETKDHDSLLNYAPDLFHPNDRGYQNWDAAFWQVVKPLVH
jgi:acyl-CoA thioesterase-1